MRVLIVDDNVDSADMLSTLIGTLGHETRTVHDGRRAVEAYAEFLPDVALMDIGLPGVSGYDVARELRRSHGNGCYLVAITGWGQDEDRRQARAAGFDCHMTKPADPEALERLLAAVSADVPCDGCSECLHAPVGRIGDLDPSIRRPRR